MSSHSRSETTTGSWRRSQATPSLRSRISLTAIEHPSAIANKHRERIDALVAERDRHWPISSNRRETPIVRSNRNGLCKRCEEVLDDDALIVADPGTPTPYLGAQYELRRAGRTTVIPRAHGGLGYAIPGVVGAYYAAPDRRIIGMTADGSFGMSVGELETITRLNLPVVIIQCSNGSFGWIKELQHLYHDDRYFSVDFNPVDYAAIAKGFGFEACQVTDPDDLLPALERALADGRPYFVDVVTESQITETLPVAPWIEAEAKRLQGISLESHS